VPTRAFRSAEWVPAASKLPPGLWYFYVFLSQSVESKTTMISVCLKPEFLLLFENPISKVEGRVLICHEIPTNQRKPLGNFLGGSISYYKSGKSVLFKDEI
jgi:hypothetical protein